MRLDGNPRGPHDVGEWHCDESWKQVEEHLKKVEACFGKERNEDYQR